MRQAPRPVQFAIKGHPADIDAHRKPLKRFTLSKAHGPTRHSPIKLTYEAGSSRAMGSLTEFLRLEQRRPLVDSNNPSETCCHYPSLVKSSNLDTSFITEALLARSLRHTVLNLPRSHETSYFHNVPHFLAKLMCLTQLYWVSLRCGCVMKREFLRRKRRTVIRL